MTKREQILETCTKVINGIEDNILSGNSAALLCKKIARLSNDEEAMTWLSYETGGYPRNKDGYIDSKAWSIGCSHGRRYVLKNKDAIFTELIDEIETEMSSLSKAINNFNTAGVSFDGDKALLTSKSFTANVHNSTSECVIASGNCARKKSILINEYYNYALKKQIEIEFGNINLSIFEKYQTRVDKYISSLCKEIHEKMKAINVAIERNDLESYSQALTSCRKIFNLVGKELFTNIFPNFGGKIYKTKANNEIDVSGDHTKNQLSAVIETMTQKAGKNSLVGSNIVYLIDLLDSLYSSQSKGVHNDVDKETAEECIIQTYIALGKILELYDNYINYKKV